MILPEAANHLASSEEVAEEYIVDMAIPDVDDPIFSSFGYEPEWPSSTAHEPAQAMERVVEKTTPSKSELAKGLEPELPAKAPNEFDNLLADLLPSVDSPLASSSGYVTEWPLPNAVVRGTVAARNDPAGAELEELAQGLEPEFEYPPAKALDELDQLDAELEDN